MLARGHELSQGPLVRLVSTCYRTAMETVIYTRVDKQVYTKIVRRQKQMKKLTGIEPSISAVARAMITEAANGKKRRQ